MDLKQLDALAHRQQALPAGLNLPETYYFLQMRALYAMFAVQAISAEQAKEEKQTVLRTYRDFALLHRIGEQDMHILRQIQRQKDYYSQNGCPVCKQLANQLCGLYIEVEELEVQKDESVSCQENSL